MKNIMNNPIAEGKKRDIFFNKKNSCKKFNKDYGKNTIAKVSQIWVFVETVSRSGTYSCQGQTKACIFFFHEFNIAAHHFPIMHTI